MVSGQPFGSSAVSLACISSMCSVQCFPGGHCLRLAFGSFFYHRFLLFVQTVFLSLLSSATLGFLCNRCFFVILAGRSSLRLAMVFCLGVSSAISWFESSSTALLPFFSRDGSTVVLRSLA